MTKVSSEDLILLQSGELSQERSEIVENEIKTNKKLQKELEVLRKADLAIENHFNNFEMPKDFQKQVKKKFKKEFNFFAFLDSKLILSYSGGIATACFMFAFVYSIDPFLQLQGQRNNDLVVRGNIPKNISKKLMPKTWIVNENFNFQMVKFSNSDNQSISVNQNQKLNIGDNVLIRIIPLNGMTVSLLVENKFKTTIIKENLIVKKGKEILLPESIGSTKKTFKVEGPAGKESFLIKNENDKTVFKFDYEIN